MTTTYALSLNKKVLNKNGFCLKHQKIFNESTPESKKQRFAMFKRKIFEFQSDNTGGWHGYQGHGSEVLASVLKEFETMALIKNSDF